MELNRLGARTVKTINTPGRHSDGGGLYLSIKNGGKSWLFLYRDRVSGKLKEMGLGSFEAVPLAEARQKAAAARLQLSNGEDPLAAKKAERAKRKKAKNFGDYCVMGLIRPIFFGVPPPTLIAFSKASRRAICQLNPQPSLNWSSILKKPRRLASPSASRSCCWPTR